MPGGGKASMEPRSLDPLWPLYPPPPSHKIIQSPPPHSIPSGPDGHQLDWLREQTITHSHTFSHTYCHTQHHTRQLTIWCFKYTSSALVRVNVLMCLLNVSHFIKSAFRTETGICWINNDTFVGVKSKLNVHYETVVLCILRSWSKPRHTSCETADNTDDCEVCLSVWCLSLVPEFKLSSFSYSVVGWVASEEQ